MLLAADVSSDLDSQWIDNEGESDVASSTIRVACGCVIPETAIQKNISNNEPSVPRTGPGSQGSGTNDASDFELPGWEMVVFPIVDQKEGQSAFPTTTIPGGEVYKFSYYEVSMETRGGQESNAVGDGLSMTIVAGFSEQTTVLGGLSVGYGSVQVSAGRETSVSYDYSQEINIEIPGTPGYIYSVVPVVQKARVRYETWRVSPQKVLNLQYSNEAYIAGVKYIVYRECVDPESIGPGS